MRRTLIIVSTVTLLWTLAVPLWCKKGKTTTPAKEKDKVTTQEKKEESVPTEKKGEVVIPQKKGGINPFLASLLIGPRVGLEMNEGKTIETTEWIDFFLTHGLVSGYQAYQNAGCTECLLVPVCGPRVGK
ncbi:MAG: hypothetical protein QMD71_09830 [bacterium]|nr:hypothetical protein [bacterium]